jgi:hypothetical protein
MGAPLILDLAKASSDVAVVDGAMFTPAHDRAHGNGSEFLRIQGKSKDGNEAGFNSDAGRTLDDKSGSKTLLLSEFQQVTIKGSTFFEFILNVNEPRGGGKSSIYLTALRIFASNQPAGSSLSGLGDPVYDLDAGGDRSILLDAATNGHGKIDMIVDIPSDAFANKGEKYVTLYSAFSSASGGAETWSALVGEIPEPLFAGASAIVGVLLIRKRK